MGKKEPVMPKAKRRLFLAEGTTQATVQKRMGSWKLFVHPGLWRSSESILHELHESHFLHTCVWPLCELCKLWLFSLRGMVGSEENSSDWVNWADFQGSTIWGECRDCGRRQFPGSTEWQYAAELEGLERQVPGTVTPAHSHPPLTHNPARLPGSRSLRSCISPATSEIFSPNGSLRWFSPPQCYWAMTDMWCHITLRCTTYWFDTFIYRKMMTAMVLANTSIGSRNCHFFFCGENIQDLLS